MALVGRDRPLQTLTDAARDAASGSGRLVLVAGEAGVGKSALVEAANEQSTRARWLTGQCEPQFTPRPLGPLLDVAAALNADLPGLLGDQTPRVELFAAVAVALAEPRVWVIEDAHWADEATLDLLRFLARRLSALPSLVVVTHRTDADGADPGWRQTLAELSRARSTVRIDLEPLDLAAVGELARGSALDPALLHRLTGGNAFFLTELLAQGSTEPPSSARDAVLGRALALSPAARRAVEVLAVIGGRIPPDLATAAGVGDVELDEIVRSGLLVADGRQLRFRHELTRLAIEGEIGPHRRPALHDRVFAALELRKDDDPARLAYHADEAGRGADALRLASAAGVRAAALGAHREAAAQYRRALRHAEGLESQQRAALHDALADELAFLDRWEESADERLAAIALWRDLDQPLRVGDDLRRLCVGMWRRCEGAESNRYAEEAVALLEPLGPSAELGWAYLTRSAGSPDLGRLALDAERALRVADALRQPALTHHLLLADAEREFRTGGDWETPLRTAADLATALGLDQLGGAAYSTMYEFFVSTFRIHEGEVAYRTGLSFCDDRELATYGSCLRGRRALALAETGRWRAAIDVAGEVLDSTASKVNQLTSRVATALARMRTAEGDPDEVLDPAVTWAASLGEPPWIVLTRLARVERHWLLGDDDSARSELAAAEACLNPTFPVEIAEVAGWRHRLDRRAQATEAVADWELRGCGYRAALALVDLGDPISLGEALARLEAMGAAGASRLVRTRLRDQGVRAAATGRKPATRRHPQGLTERQQQILELLRAGLTNNEIADALVISPKTVDHHVSAVLAKLGVSTRREAARVARIHRWPP